MVHAVEYHSALITVSSVFVGIAGIVFAVVLSHESTIFKPIIRWFISLSLISIFAGIICMIFALTWFSLPSDSATLVSGIALIIQFACIFSPLVTLIQPYLNRGK